MLSGVDVLCLMFELRFIIGVEDTNAEDEECNMTVKPDVFHKHQIGVLLLQIFIGEISAPQAKTARKKISATHLKCQY